MSMVSTSVTLPEQAALDLRVLRAVPFATVCFVLSATGHAVASGCQVPVAVLLLGWIAVCVPAVALAGRERSLRAITIGGTVGQMVLRLLFQAARTTPRGGGGGPGKPAMPGMPGMAMAEPARSGPHAIP
ncbi:hypothetical protein [Kitasatospora sp. McL0602]|uniref:hypothetical protein n=1 Tax=Kitasatospora sp. McL0602 TaxID=3439530 RepID=UPI003F8A912C